MNSLRIVIAFVCFYVLPGCGQSVKKWPEHIENISTRSLFSTALVEKVAEFYRTKHTKDDNVYIAICALERVNEKTKLTSNVIIMTPGGKCAELIFISCEFTGLDDFLNKILTTIKSVKPKNIPFREAAILLRRIEKTPIRPPKGKSHDWAMGDGYPNCVVVMQSNAYVIRQSSGADFWGPSLDFDLGAMINKWRNLY
jgi:hypothetical protein